MIASSAYALAFAILALPVRTEAALVNGAFALDVIAHGDNAKCNHFLHCPGSSSFDDCMTDLDVGKRERTAFEALRSPVVVLSDTTVATEANLEDLLTNGRSVCNLFFGSLANIANLTQLENALWKASNMTFFLFADPEEQLVADPKIMKFGVVIVKPAKSKGALSPELVCPFQGSMGVVNLWQSDSGFLLPPSTMVCKHVLNGQHILVSGPNGGYRPFNVYDDRGDIVSGVDVDVLEATAEVLNFTYQIEIDGVWGELYPTGGWGGIVGAVKNGTRDFGIGHFLMSDFHYMAIEYLHYLYPLDLIIFGPFPRPIVPVTNIIEPFDRTVWILVIVGLFLVTILIGLIMLEAERVQDIKPYTLYQVLTEPCVETLRTFFNQAQTDYVNSDRAPKTVLVVFWFISDFFIKSFFTSLLLAYLLQTKYEAPMNTVEDVLAQGSHLYVIAGTPMDLLLQVSPQASYQQMFHQVVDGNQYASVTGGMFDYDLEKKMIDERSCFLNSKLLGLGNFAGEVARWGYEPWRQSTEVTFPFYSGFVTQKNAIYNYELNEVMMYFLDSGLIDVFVSKYISDKYLHPPKSEDPPPAALTIMHFLGSLIVLGMLGIVAAIVFVGEHLHYRSEKARKSRKAAKAAKAAKKMYYC